MIKSSKIDAIPYGAIREPGDDKRRIPQGMFKPHMTWMVSGKTGSGKSTALIRLLKPYCDAGVFQKVILISPTANFAKPATAARSWAALTNRVPRPPCWTESVERKPRGSEAP